MKNVSFSNIVSHGYVVNLNIANNLIILDSQCSMGNSTAQNRSYKYSSLGGCFRSTNVFFRKFEGVKVFDCFSDKTTYGIILIDNHQNQKSLSNYEFSNESMVFFMRYIILIGVFFRFYLKIAVS